ncbi:sugar phosphate isomerase/epimerase [Xylanibacillus composti]|uniref:Xylose isomerase-like TIM barrel domain-containing protein n=1 Tax=Xylanibacillus composti TaxID=1572762 RepID=A0A8J4GY93_9BACL|nr:TIM barrel protein [Xylanibacillus composti]MDT9723887.1 sugar phosphate isomerase/epimerase [Xylanibacillus composti]GIQ67334.1 hypothetical protein XYCOK13_01580 [Xylanibacillus composti]
MTAYSIGSWSFHALFEAGKMNVFGYLESIKYRYRLQHADIWNGMLASTEPAYIASIHETLKEEELVVANLAVDGADIWHDDPGVREHNAQKARAYLEIARKWGVQALRIDLGIHDKTMTEEQFECCVKRYQEYAQFAADHGFRVGPQTHQLAAQVPSNLKRLAEAVSSPAFGIVLNVNRWEAEHDKGDEIAAPITMHAQLDRAFVDFTGPELVQKIELLQQAGYQGCWSLEFRGGKDEYIETAHDLLTIQRAVRTAAN